MQTANREDAAAWGQADKPHKIGHVCPPSTATHPRDRWETSFVYAFVQRFLANGKEKAPVLGLDTPMDLEAALLSNQPEPVLEQILQRFVKNLRPKKGNVAAESISHTVSLVVADYLKLPERSVFWDDELEANMNPLEEVGFFSAPWDTKLRVLRQLVEWQLSHCAIIRQKIDVAWNVQHNLHKRKPGDPTPKPPPPDDPESKEQLTLVPIGQDLSRKRYWIVDDSPRIYVSSNPWKVTATYETAATTVAEYRKVIDDLKAAYPEQPAGHKKKKFEQMHLDLIKFLENRAEIVEQEMIRIQKHKKKVEREAEFARQAAEVRGTRTRRATKKPDYVYNDPGSDQDDGGDDYNFQEQDEEEDDVDFESVASGPAAPRRSTRKAVLNGNGKRPAVFDDVGLHGERRSTRQAAAAAAEWEKEKERAPKRARTESPPAIELPATGGHFPVIAQKHKIVKDNEQVVEQVAGKKKSKFWV
ncbi:hypothetical protein AURDEDRAFT_55949 [Auricularia subglabra TFB-10046 SS5]|nr:hypothetical protein AURDEDRAFT_55949 [Auricularia subglabra TFB-10046 SS5]